MSKREREERKAALLVQVQQQRLDLSAARRDWFQVTERYDRGWLTLISLRRWAAVGSGVMALWSVRHPRGMMRWARRGFGAWSTWRLVRNQLKR
ncbi:hypothetical protein CIG19_11225 [Enterobacterales bacterium CwR94]|nr:hypothetical protein CIG19_11225 [Enterobacterales bacterium CwR94]